MERSFSGGKSNMHQNVGTLRPWYKAEIPELAPKSIGEGASGLLGRRLWSLENVSCSWATPDFHRWKSGVAQEQETFSRLQGLLPKRPLAPSPIDLGEVQEFRHCTRVSGSQRFGAYHLVSLSPPKVGEKFLGTGDPRFSETKMVQRCLNLWPKSPIKIPNSNGQIKGGGQHGQTSGLFSNGFWLPPCYHWSKLAPFDDWCFWGQKAKPPQTTSVSPWARRIQGGPLQILQNSAKRIGETTRNPPLLALGLETDLGSHLVFTWAVLQRKGRISRV